MVLGALLTGLEYGKKAFNWYQKEKQNQSGLLGKLATAVGNHIQENYINKMDNGLLKIGAETLNKTFLNPTSNSQTNNYPDVKNGAVRNETYNSSNASYSGGEGSLYGTKPGARNPYDYASTDFDSILRKQANMSASTPRQNPKRTRRKVRSYRRFD